MKTLVIDNYDSFVFNLVQYIGEFSGNPEVFRNDEISLKKIEEINPSHIVISPGPGNPSDRKYFGICSEIIKKFGVSIPLLGVCLGHQGIAYSFGGKVIQAPKIMHGKQSIIHHDSKGLFKDVPQNLEVMRYHSLCVEKSSLPDCLEISAETDEGIIMGLRHKKHPIEGVQFHPESIGTNEGKKIIKNFLNCSPL